MKVLTLAAAAALFAVPALAWDDPETMSRFIDQTNFIIGDGKGYCSGTLIDAEKKLIVTAYHCIDGEIRIVERDEDGEDGEVKKKRVRVTDKVTVQQRLYEGHVVTGSVSYIAEIVAHAKKSDLAILQPLGPIHSTTAAPLQPENETVWRGDPVWAIGNPLGMDASITAGMVSAKRMVEWLIRGEETPMIQFSAPIAPGSSGGAVYNAKGQYIGTSVGGIRGAELNIAVPVSELWTLLGTMEQSGSGPAHPPVGMRFHRIVPDIARQMAERMGQ